MENLFQILNWSYRNRRNIYGNDTTFRLDKINFMDEYWMHPTKIWLPWWNITWRRLYVYGKATEGKNLTCVAKYAFQL